jgi:hypothetical protein
MVEIFPAELQESLRHFGITRFDEVALRQELEARVETYTLIRLAAWPARRWKCRYRVMMGSGMYDAQNVPEAYGRALLAALQASSEVGQ